MKKDKKWIQYSAQILSAITDMFDEDNEYHIDTKELMEGNNLTEFFHALANVAPAHLFNKLTGDEKNHLEFNHIANQLCFQYINKED